MPSSIFCSTKSLTLAIAQFLFILVCILCEFAMVPGVSILLSPQEEEVHYFSWGHRCINRVHMALGKPGKPGKKLFFEKNLENLEKHLENVFFFCKSIMNFWHEFLTTQGFFSVLIFPNWCILHFRQKFLFSVKPLVTSE